MSIDYYEGYVVICDNCSERETIEIYPDICATDSLEVQLIDLIEDLKKKGWIIIKDTVLCPNCEAETHV